MSVRTRGARSQGGAALVEFAVVLPVMLLLVFGIIDFGVVLHHRGLVGNGAREGARVGAVNPDLSAIEAAAKDGANITPASDVTVTTTCEPAPCTFTSGHADEIEAGDTVVVKVEYEYELLTPVAQLFSSTLHVESTARMRFEGA